MRLHVLGAEGQVARSLRPAVDLSDPTSVAIASAHSGPISSSIGLPTRELTTPRIGLNARTINRDAQTVTPENKMS